MSARLFCIVVSSSLMLGLTAGPAAAHDTSLVPQVGYPLQFTVSPPARNMPPQAQGAGRPQEIPRRYPPGRPSSGNVTDPLVQSSTPTAAAAQTLGNFEGLGVGYPEFSLI